MLTDYRRQMTDNRLETTDNRRQKMTTEASHTMSSPVSLRLRQAKKDCIALFFCCCCCFFLFFFCCCCCCCFFQATEDSWRRIIPDSKRFWLCGQTLIPVCDPEQEVFLGCNMAGNVIQFGSG